VDYLPPSFANPLLDHHPSRNLPSPQLPGSYKDTPTIRTLSRLGLLRPPPHPLASGHTDLFKAHCGGSKALLLPPQSLAQSTRGYSAPMPPPARTTQPRPRAQPAFPRYTSDTRNCRAIPLRPPKSFRPQLLLMPPQDPHAALRPRLLPLLRPHPRIPPQHPSANRHPRIVRPNTPPRRLRERPNEKLYAHPNSSPGATYPHTPLAPPTCKIPRPQRACTLSSDQPRRPSQLEIVKPPSHGHCLRERVFLLTYLRSRHISNANPLSP